MTEDVRDRPAERGITMTNILLGLLVTGGSVFGTMVIQDISAIKETTVKMGEAITMIQVQNGRYDEQLRECRAHHVTQDKINTEVSKRLRTLERKVP
jgi:hypothetical protein